MHCLRVERPASFPAREGRRRADHAGQPRPAAARLSWSVLGGGRAAGEAGAWVTLESEDDQASTFWTSLIEALRRAEPSFPKFAPLVPSDTVDRSVLGRLAAPCATAAADRAVLAASRQLAGRLWAADLEFVLRHADQRLRLVLVGAGIRRCRCTGTAGRRAHRDPQRRLAFTAAEAASCSRAPRRARDGPCGAAGAHEGWRRAAAVRERPAGPHGPGRGGRHHLGRRHDLRRVFRREVLGSSRGGTRFLLETSVLDTFTPELARRSTSVPMPGGYSPRSPGRTPSSSRRRRPGRYRYHRLCRRLLRAQLTWEELDLVPRAAPAGARGWRARARVVEAASHAVWAGEWPERRRSCRGLRHRPADDRRPPTAGWAGVPRPARLGRLAELASCGRLGGRRGPRGDLAAERCPGRTALIEQDGIGCDDALRLAGCWSRSTRRWRPTRRRATRSRRPRPCWPSRRGVRRAAPGAGGAAAGARRAAQSRAGAIDTRGEPRRGDRAAGAGCEQVKIECLGRLG